MEVLPALFALTGNASSGMMGSMPDPSPTSLQIFALFIIFFFPAIALVVVLIRVAGRFATKQFGWDDSLISVAMFLSLAETVISYFCKCSSREENLPLLQELTILASHQNQLHRYSY